MVITAAGNLEHARLVDLVAREFGGAARSVAARKARTPPETTRAIEQRDKKELEQVHIVLGVPSYPLAHERRYAASLMNIILGGGMSSRLFQNIRERQGLAYAIGSDLSPYTDSGVLSVYAGTSRDSAARLIRSVCEEFRSIRQRGERGRTSPRQGSSERLDDAFPRIDQRAHVQPGPPGHVLPPLYFTRRNAGVDRKSNARGSTAIARDFFEPDRFPLTVLGNLNGFRRHARIAGL